MAATKAKLMTAEELLNMPRDGYRYELITRSAEEDGSCWDIHMASFMRLTESTIAYLRACCNSEQI